MLNLLKSDLYRLVHGKTLAIAVAVLVLGTVLALWVLGIATPADNDTPQISYLPVAAGGISNAGISPSNLFGCVCLSTGLLNIVACMLVALTFATDFETGYVKSIWSAGDMRRPYMAEKLVLCLVISAFLLLVSVLAAQAASAIIGIQFESNDNPSDFAAWLVLAWLTISAYLFATASVTLLARSRAIGVVAAALLGTGILANMLVYFYGILTDMTPAAARTHGWLLADNLERLAGGSAGIGLGAPQLACVAVAVMLVCAAVVITAGTHRDV